MLVFKLVEELRAAFFGEDESDSRGLAVMSLMMSLLPSSSKSSAVGSALVGCSCSSSLNKRLDHLSVLKSKVLFDNNS